LTDRQEVLVDKNFRS
jgi:hypothetical protein